MGRKYYKFYVAVKPRLQKRKAEIEEFQRCELAEEESETFGIYT